MVTGKSHPGADAFQSLPPTATQSQPIATSPPSKRDLASWWRQFKKNTRKVEQKEKPQGIFGVPLNVSIKYANVAISLTNDNGESFIYGYVPIVVAKCGVFLKEKATDVEGIFRLNGSAKRIKDLQEIFDSPERYGKGLDWSGYTVHDAANVLRRYLNQLPEPIVPLEFYEKFREPLRTYQQQVQGNGPTADSVAFDHARAVAAYQALIRELPPLNKQLLLYILDLLAVFASKSEQNRMTSANLSAIFQPGLLSHPQHDMSPEEYKLSQDVLIFLIENQDHFLFGMNGTAADEQTVKEVEGGLMPRAPSHSTVRRSVSNASGTDSFRKYESLRRNVSVSSKNSRNSNNAPSPGTPSSLSGVGVHRSNTLPSKMSPAIPPSRYARAAAAAEPAAVNPSANTPSAQNSRSASRTPPPREDNAQPSGQTGATPTTIGFAYVHTSTHGPIPKPTEDRPLTAKKMGEQDPTPVPVSSPPPAVVTPSRDRKLSSFFSKSPPPSGDHNQPRQPNRLKKKRIPGSASESAQSSSQSLQAATSDPNLMAMLQAARAPSETNEVGGTTPRPHNTSFPTDETTSQAKDVKHEPLGNVYENGNHPATDNSLKPYGSRTPSMNSRSSFTDQSDFDQADDASRSERKERRRSWRFPRSSKRSNEHIGLGLGSPPLIATNPGAQRSTSSIGSWHHASRSSPSDLQQFANDLANQPLSLDAEVSNNGQHHLHNSEPEKRGLFEKFKAKVAQVRDGGRDSDRDEVKSPVYSDTERSVSSQPLSPPGREILSSRPAPIEIPKDYRDEPLSTPISPLPGSGLPPPIPEEPNSPESPVAVAAAELKKENASAAAEPRAAPPSETVPTSEPNNGNTDSISS